MLEKFKKTKLYLGWAKFIGILKPMTWEKRFEYLWMYYKEYAFCALMLLMVLSVLATVLVHQTKDTIVSGILVNTTMSQEGMNYLTQDYKAELAPDDKNKLVELEYTTFSVHCCSILFKCEDYVISVKNFTI